MSGEFTNFGTQHHNKTVRVFLNSAHF